LISQNRGGVKSFYLYDGLGSVRDLTNSSGIVTDRYNYDAYGNLLNSSGSTSNNYRFTGEQFDPNLGDYYLRDRYYGTDIGRFTRADTFQGNINDPISLHDCIYANGNPVIFTDPSGKFSIAEFSAAESIRNTLAGIQANAGGYLISAALSDGEYGLKEFLTDFAWNVGITAGLTLAAKGISAIFHSGGIAKSEVAQEVSRGLSYNVPVNDVVSRSQIRAFGIAIAESPVATAVYSRLREMGVDIRLNFTSYPMYKGYKVEGQYFLGGRIEIFMQNTGSVKNAVGNLVHEGVHAERFIKFGQASTRYEEYLAYRRQLLFSYERRPTLQERRELWDFVNQAYSDLPVGKSPF
jgi:RHS repeat-associated protein